MKPKRDWKILIISFGLLTVIIMAAGIFMIYLLNEGTLFKSFSQTDDTQLLNQKKLVQHLNNGFRDKTSEYEAFQQNVPIFTDPSL